MNKFEGIIENNKKIVVFGGAGFIGSNIVNVLAKLGHEVLVIDNLKNGDINKISKSLELDNVKFEKDDILNLDRIIELTKGYNYFIHQAALGSVSASMEIPQEYIINNDLGTVNVFEAARVNNIEAVVYASSSSVYGDEDSYMKVEDKTGNLLSIYALTKKINEEYANAYNEFFNLNVIGLRYFNVFGPLQSVDSAYAAVIPKFISATLEGQAIEIHGDGKQTRDFIYVDNVVLANLLALKNAHNHSGKAYNVGTNYEVMLNDMVTVLEDKMGVVMEKNIVGSRIGDIKNSLSDINNINKDLGYSPIVMFQDGLDDTIKYYRSLNK